MEQGAGHLKRGRIGRGGCHKGLAQGQERQDCDDANRDHHGFKEPEAEVAERNPFAVRAQDWEEANGGADGGDDEHQLHQRAQDHLVRMCSPVDEIVRVGENGRVEVEEAQHGRNRRQDKHDAHKRCASSVSIHGLACFTDCGLTVGVHLFVSF